MAQIDNEWLNKMPCKSCNISSICKYANVIKRVDYPSDVFDINIECNIKYKYNVIEERL